MTTTTDVSGMTRDELTAYVLSAGYPAYRSGQLFKWLHRRMIQSFDEMTDLPKAMRENLKQTVRIQTASLARQTESGEPGVRKFLFRLHDGCAVESVLMQQPYGDTVCVSSQAGCRMGCVFCASAKHGLARGLSAGEIASQVYESQKLSGRRVSNVVVMGTGEPFDNYDATMSALAILNDKEGLNIGQRSITVSTCGIIDGILRFANENTQINLAVSLHAPNDDIRARLMPVARRNPMDELLSACEYYQTQTRRRVSYEYALAAGINDSSAHAKELAARVKGTLCHVNVMALNGGGAPGLKKPTPETVSAFANTLKTLGVEATVRRGRGADINAACGQLRHMDSSYV